jgi:hypothetical protein
MVCLALYVQQTSRAVWFRGVKTLFKKLSRCSYQRTTVQVRASGQHSDSGSPVRNGRNQTQTNAEPADGQARRRQSPDHSLPPFRHASLLLPSALLPLQKNRTHFPGAPCSLRFRRPLFARGNRSELAGGAPRSIRERGAVEWPL